MTRTIPARKTVFRKISNDEALSFVTEHHRKGSARPGKSCRSYGLFHEAELVAVAVFSNPRTIGMMRKYTTELFRMAFKNNVRVQGGASKLIKGFITTERPFDLFTYQDSSGENTDLYKHSGMTLVKEATTKEVLVKNGMSFAEADNNFRDWISIEQAVRHGPDSLLGTSIGERYRADGTRKNNLDLFIDECGYHKETIPGDSIFEWINPDVSYYIYKITSRDNDGYYIGRRVIKMASPTDEDCLSDGYMGSGGKKFKEWVLNCGPNSMVKSVISIHHRWSDAVKFEKAAIADLHLIDPNCMNTMPGGTGISRGVIVFTVKNCPTHGDTLHNGPHCVKCSISKIFTTKNCPIHGSTTFRGLVCEKCTHGKRYHTAECSKHGITVFRVTKCVMCSNSGISSIRECPTHGMVLHQGLVCSTCNSRSSVNLQECSVHGMTKHQGDVCNKCNSLSSISQRECAEHGVTTFQGDSCMRCNAASQITTMNCAVHGDVLHKGMTCTMCTAQKAITQMECPKHGLTKHQGNVCNKCNSQKSVSERECPKHGLTKHQGNICNKCNSQKSVNMRECAKHGLTKHQGEKCSACTIEALIQVRECPTHGMWKHRGKSCYACVSDKRRAKKATAV